MNYVSKLFLLSLFAVAPNIAKGQDSTAVDYSYDISAFEKKPLEYSASIEAWPTLLSLNNQSPLYRLKYHTGTAYADIYNCKLEGLARFQHRQFFANISGALNVDYPRYEDTLGTQLTLYEGYFKYTPFSTLSIFTGKKTFRWGKGYAYNPVAFAGRPKDLNNIDATLEGYWSFSLDYTKSFDGALSSITASSALLPVYKELNSDFLPDRSLAAIAQIYCLLLNT